MVAPIFWMALGALIFYVIQRMTKNGKFTEALREETASLRADIKKKL